MGFLKAILELFRRIFGLGKQEPVLSLGAAAANPAPAVEDDDDDENDDEVGEEGAPAGGHDPDATRDGQLNIEEEWADMQLFIQRCELEPIDLAGLDVNDPASFWARQGQIEQSQAGGLAYLPSVVAAGFRGVEHWEQVSRYFQAKWSALIRHSNGEREIRPREEFTSAAGVARGAWVPQVDPKMLEPVRGVTLEQWARASAALSRMSAHATPAEVDETLAPLGLDRARYESVNATWQDRMRRDPSLTIATRFGEVFETR